MKSGAKLSQFLRVFLHVPTRVSLFHWGQVFQKRISWISWARCKFCLIRVVLFGGRAVTNVVRLVGWLFWA